MHFSIFGYLSEVEITFDPPDIEFHVTVFFQVIKPFIGLTCYCMLLSLCTSLDSFHLSLPMSDSHYLSVRRLVYVQYFCVTFLPLSAAESAAGAEPEPPTVQRTREGEVLGYRRTRCHSVRSASLPTSTEHTTSCLTPLPAPCPHPLVLNSAAC